MSLAHSIKFSRARKFAQGQCLIFESSEGSLPPILRPVGRSGLLCAALRRGVPGGRFPVFLNGEYAEFTSTLFPALAGEFTHVDFRV